MLEEVPKSKWLLDARNWFNQVTHTRIQDKNWKDLTTIIKGKPPTNYSPLSDAEVEEELDEDELLAVELVEELSELALAEATDT